MAVPLTLLFGLNGTLLGPVRELCRSIRKVLQALRTCLRAAQSLIHYHSTEPAEVLMAMHIRASSCCHCCAGPCVQTNNAWYAEAHAW